MAGLFTGGTGGRAASGAAASTSGATPDFLAQSDDPDRRRLQAAAPQPSGALADISGYSVDLRCALEHDRSVRALDMQL